VRRLRLLAVPSQALCHCFHRSASQCRPSATRCALILMPVSVSTSLLAADSFAAHQ
jgi:hypothetical protein